MTEPCKVPPEGWSCSRPAGHEGPCAATSTQIRTVAGEKVAVVPEIEWLRANHAAVEAAGFHDSHELLSAYNTLAQRHEGLQAEWVKLKDLVPRLEKAVTGLHSSIRKLKRRMF